MMQYSTKTPDKQQGLVPAPSTESWKTPFESPLHPLRATMQSRVERELRARYPTRMDWQSKCKEMARQLEQVLFRTARSLSDYRDDSTVTYRLAMIAAAKKKRNEVQSTVSVQQLCFNLFDKAKSSWLAPEEIDIIFGVFGNQRALEVSPMLTLDSNSSPFGKLFLFWSHVMLDGFIWRDPSHGDAAQQQGHAANDCELVLSSNGNPKIWMSTCSDFSGKFHRRIYWSIQHIGKVLVHYLMDNSSFSLHSQFCCCLNCQLGVISTSSMAAEHVLSTADQGNFPFGENITLPNISLASQLEAEGRNQARETVAPDDSTVENANGGNVRQKRVRDASSPSKKGKSSEQ